MYPVILIKSFFFLTLNESWPVKTCFRSSPVLSNFILIKMDKIFKLYTKMMEIILCF